MSSQAKKIPIKKIVTDPRYYPRAIVDQRRILEFLEAMECGEYFPPIKLVRDPKTGLYILLDGKHRLEAYIMRNEVEIMADILTIPEEHWLMASARFNGKSSKPLTANETRIIIIQTWNSGIKDTDEIAREMGRTSRYVEMIVKPVRDEERDQRKKDILELQEKGMKQYEIASELGLSASCICKTLKHRDDENNESLVSENSGLSESIPGSDAVNEKFPKRNDFVLEISSIKSNINELHDTVKNSDQNNANVAPVNLPPQESDEENHKIFQPSEESDAVDEKFPKRNDFVLEISSIKSNINELHDTVKNSDQNDASVLPANPPPEVFTKGSDFLLVTPDEENNISQLKPLPQKVFPDLEKISPENSSAAIPLSGNDSQNNRTPLTQKSSSYPSYMDQIDLYNELTPEGQHAIRAMELAKKYKVDILDIAKETGEPVIWTKKVLMSAIALSLMNGDKLNSLSRVETAIGIDFYIAEAIQAMLPFQTMLCPATPEMEQWIKDNLSSQDLDIILDLVDAPKNDIRYLLKGQKPPAPKKNCFQELPKSYKENFQAYRSMLREVRDHNKNKMFNANSAKELLAQFNKNMIIVNEIVDDMREEGIF